MRQMNCERNKKNDLNEQTRFDQSEVLLTYHKDLPPRPSSRIIHRGRSLGDDHGHLTVLAGTEGGPVCGQAVGERPPSILAVATFVGAAADVVHGFMLRLMRLQFSIFLKTKSITLEYGPLQQRIWPSYSGGCSKLQYHIFWAPKMRSLIQS